FQRFLNRIGDLEVSFAQKSYQYLPEAQLQLRAQAGRLVQRQGVRVLMHERWLQPVPPRDQPEPLLVQRDLRLGQLHLLEGTLAVTIGRYLHLQANLWYQVPGLGAEPVDIAFPPDGSASADLSASAFEHAGYMALSESRRTRSGELHYLDHPRLGVIVRIDPVAIPADVLESFEALKELP
ncbi:MAG: CsiV family protein, partial [Proteobacteria bacterium]|nr:CsiV family protein [Pseudomonadota bacterium]